MKRNLLALCIGLSGLCGAADSPYRVDGNVLPDDAQIARSIDYGSFRWIWASPDSASALRQGGLSVQAMRGTTISLAGIARDPTQSTAEALLDEQGKGLYIVQFYGPQKPEWLQALSASGLVPLQFVPDNALLVYGTPAATESARALDTVRGTLPLTADLKSEGGALATANPNGVIRVLYVNRGNPDSMRDRVSGLGATVLRNEPAQPDGQFYTIDLAVAGAPIGALLQSAEVVHVGFEANETIEDEQANQIVGNNFASPTSLQLGYNSFLLNGLGGLSGQGVSWSVVDTGADASHPDLAAAWIGGVTNGCTLGNDGPGDDAAGGGHGTHVAGAILGRGVGDGNGPAAETDANGFLYGLGIAPATKLWGARIVCAGNTLSDIEWTRQSIAAGVQGSNNSWNNGGAQSGYTASAREYDILVRDGDFNTATVREPFHVFFSAGNAGTAGMTAPHEAKNIVSVANSGTPRSTTTSNLISGSSSRGPAVDGRILPVLTAPGTQTASTRNPLGGSCATAIGGTEGLYALCSGTSMSTPRASGAAALTIEWWRNRNAGSDPSPAMVKAILVNGARDIPGSSPGNAALIDGSRPIPNNDEGWGIIDLRATLAPEVRGIYLDQATVLNTVGQTETVRVRAVDPAKPLRITLAWTDAPGAVSASPALVNNLDLTVTQGAQTYRGNVFTGGTSVTGGTADILSNLENVYLASPGTAPVDVAVRASALNGDALSGNGTPGSAKQDYALLCTNCTLASATYTIAAPTTPIAACAGQSAPAATVVLQSSSSSEAVTLTTNAAPAAFGAVQFAPNPATPSLTGTNVAVTAAIAAGASGAATLPVRGTSTGGTIIDASISYVISTAAPAAATLSSPIAAATDVAPNATFTWTVAAGANGYRFDLSRSADFSTLVESKVVSGTSTTAARPLRANATYYWRIVAQNACGPAAAASGQFTTVVGDTLLSDGFGD